MDALVDGLLEELNCDVVFKIPIFGGIPIYESVVVTWIIMAAVFLHEQFTVKTIIGSVLITLGTFVMIL